MKAWLDGADWLHVERPTKTGYHDMVCPHTTPEAGCGLWCPRCRYGERTDNRPDGSPVVERTVTIYCGCQPIAYDLSDPPKAEKEVTP